MAAAKVIDEFPIDPNITNLDTLTQNMWDLTYHYTFNPSQGTIRAIINSSSLHLIRNHELRTKVIACQDVFVDYEEGEKDATEDMMHHLYPYLNEFFPFDMNLEEPRFDQSILTTLQFENMILQRHDNLATILESDNELEKMTQMIDDIISLTKKETQE